MEQSSLFQTSVVHELKVSAFCKPKTTTATTGAQKPYLTLGSHHIFCNAINVLRDSFAFFLSGANVTVFRHGYHAPTEYF